ncbi:MAG: hypothetical protein IJH64_04310 [Oscillospiraceae bacterium]|nr:hypothetical protein [Oscillospiraceae bacterium]
MRLKTKIKNDLWRVNYILPFAKKYQFDEKGKADFAKQILRTYKEVKPIKSKERTVGSDTLELMKSVDIEVDPSSAFLYSLDIHKTIAVPGNIVSNFTLDYNKVIYGTFDELCAPAISLDDEYGREAMLIKEAVHTLCDRMKEIAKGNQKQWFEDMLIKPAQHFDESLQRLLFFNQILWQTRHRLNGLGRLDQILEDYYEADIKNGILTETKADKLVYDFMQSLSKYPSYKSDALEGDIGQIIILGGLNSDGSYFHNNLTEIFIRAQARINKPDPKTFLRVSEKMPRELMALAVRCLEAKTGSPLFSNDDIVIPALLDFGIPESDAYNYCVSACWEPFIVGKSFDQNNMAVFDYDAPLQEILARKREFSDLDELVDEYKSAVQKKFKVFLQEVDELKWAKDPLVSIFTANCTEKRKDISEGGAVYNNYGITTVGIANVVDSLINIDRVVFQEKVLGFDKLAEVLEKNYEGSDDLRKAADEKHYGHDDELAIRLTNEITTAMVQVAKGFRNKLGGTVKFGLSSPAYNMLSKKSGADFSGRKDGTPYNTHISCSDATYTEVVNFAGELEYGSQRFNGNVVDFFVSPTFIHDNADKFTTFMLAAIRAGFFQMQMNVMDSKTLIDAKANPEKYKGLIVRVWGFSAYFNELPESYKDLLIKRALDAERTA